MKCLYLYCKKKSFCIINRLMHVQQRMAAVLLFWILWALRLVISLTMILVRWHELVSRFFLCCDHHAWCTIIIVIPPKKTTSTDCTSRFLAPQRVISYQNTKPRKQIGSLNCIPRQADGQNHQSEPHSGQSTSHIRYSGESFLVVVWYIAQFAQNFMRGEGDPL